MPKQSFPVVFDDDLRYALRWLVYPLIVGRIMVGFAVAIAGFFGINPPGAELANIINISPTYFASLFKQAMEVSPHQYVIQQRVERAKLMLKKRDLALADIALQVGFSSQSHLTQHFKRLTGVTPKQFR